jgi:peptidoglycan/xylan/chitin deacetylase (PgdA/CDA1 family)
MPEHVSRRWLLGLCLGAGAVAACSTSPEPQPRAAPGTSTATRPVPPPPSSTPPARPSGPATEVVRGTSGRPQIALTFHGAGDLALARQVLDLLGKRGARVTVLAVGTWLTESPDAAKLVVDGGHELGNHTWSHPALSGMAPAPMLAEIERCRDKLVELTGSPGAFFRQSQGQHATAAELIQAGKAGYPRVLSYDVDSLDWTDPGAAAIRAAVAKARAGSVVSMHLGHPGTLTALPMILTDLTERGLTPVTATELLR